MKKRILSALTAAAATIVSASAFDVKIDNIYYNIINGEYLEVTSAEPYPDEILYPKTETPPAQKTIARYRDDYAINDYSGDIIVPDSVEIETLGKRLEVRKIGHCAFFNAPNLESVTLPASITELGNSAFAYSSIKRLDMGDMTIEAIIGGVCYACRELSEVILPESLIYISESAFMTSGLKSITLPGKVRGLDSQVFAYTDLSEIKGLESVESYGYDCVQKTKLKQIIIYETIRNLCFSAFKDLEYLENVISMKTDPEDFDILSYYSMDSVFRNSNPDCTLWVPDESLELYKASSRWTSFFKDIRPMSQLGLSQTAAPDSENIRYFDMTGRQVDEPTPGHLYITDQHKKILY